MFCISLANLRKWVKIPYNLLWVNEHFEGEHNDKIDFLFSLYPYFLNIKYTAATKQAKPAR